MSGIHYISVYSHNSDYLADYDILFGFDGNDELRGNDGDDFLDGDRGGNTLDSFTFKTYLHEVGCARSRPSGTLQYFCSFPGQKSIPERSYIFIFAPGHARCHT